MPIADSIQNDYLDGLLALEHVRERAMYYITKDLENSKYETFGSLEVFTFSDGSILSIRGDNVS